MIMLLVRFAQDLWALLQYLVTALAGFVNAHWILFLVLAVVLAWISIIDPAYPTTDAEGM